MMNENATRPSFAEFFCGGGFVSAALSSDWQCILANDIDSMKCSSYRQNWDAAVLQQRDIRDLDISPLLRPVDLYWASSPCQDFSLAGVGRGIMGARSSAVMPWLEIIERASLEGFQPKIIAFENVVGMLSRNSGSDLAFVLERLTSLGYRVGAFVLDAKHFLPQSRPRLFVVAVLNSIAENTSLEVGKIRECKDRSINRFVDRVGDQIRNNWISWNLAPPRVETPKLLDLMNEQSSQAWYDDEKVQHLLAIMDPPSRRRIDYFYSRPNVSIGTLYRRGRPDANGVTRQRAEVRFDGLSGCLRTPSGGSSRQTIVFAGEKRIKMRLLDAREAIRLMGADDDFILPPSYNDGYRIAGDGVAVPVVKYLSDEIFMPLLNLGKRNRLAA